MFIIRCLRPLHIISLYHSMRAIVGEIVKGWRNLVKATIIMFGFMFMFASLGVQVRDKINVAFLSIVVFVIRCMYACNIPIK